MVYVCGNHDDYLVRFSLGESLASRLHPSRAVFAAETAYFPALRTLVEHGHRVDDFNRFDPKSSGAAAGSPGELIVNMLHNPVERGGPSAYAPPVGLGGAFGRLQDAYDHFATCRAVHPRTYDAWLGCIDNLTNGALMDVVADRAGRALVEAAPDAADTADVSDLDEDIAGINNLWLRGDFQGWHVRLAGPALNAIVPPELGGLLVAAVYDVGPERLGFDPAKGLGGRSSMKVHLVGHTHDPSTTIPPLTGKVVPAQHVNTGTGQDTWHPEDRLGLDELDRGPMALAVQYSQDTLSPVGRSHYALVYTATDPLDGQIRIHVEGGKYRSLQAGSPVNAVTHGIQGGLAPQGTNRLDR